MQVRLLRAPVVLVAALLWFEQRPHTGLTSFLEFFLRCLRSRKWLNNDVLVMVVIV